MNNKIKGFMFCGHLTVGLSEKYKIIIELNKLI
jgi:hypothetical protein